MKAPASIAARPMLGIPGARELGFVLRYHPPSVSLIFTVMFFRRLQSEPGPAGSHEPALKKFLSVSELALDREMAATPFRLDAETDTCSMPGWPLHRLRRRSGFPSFASVNALLRSLRSSEPAERQLAY